MFWSTFLTIVVYLDLNFRGWVGGVGGHINMWFCGPSQFNNVLKRFNSFRSMKWDGMYCYDEILLLMCNRRSQSACD